MVEFRAIENCLITGSPISGLHAGSDFHYQSQLSGKSLDFFFCPKCFYSIPFDEIKHILVGHILNDLYSEINNQTLHWKEHSIKGGLNLKELIENSEYPRTPKEKYDYLFTHLVKRQTYDGERMSISQLRKEWQKFYFKSNREFDFYFRTLINNSLIETSSTITDPIMSSSISFDDFHVTYEGISYYISLSQQIAESKKCFIAMAFDESTNSIRIAIKNALKKTGYDPVIIDESHIDSDKTINDAIIAGLRKCKFCIADFTLHRNGVYFESGFALGQGKQVIYTCRKDEFAKAHFDIKPLQHIIYETSEELETLLVNKIEAWIQQSSS